MTAQQQSREDYWKSKLRGTDYSLIETTGDEKLRSQLKSRLMEEAIPIGTQHRRNIKEKVTEAGVRGYLRHYFPEHEIVKLSESNYAAVKPGEKPLVVEDAPSMGAGRELWEDILDVVPEIREAGYSIAGGLLGAKAGAAAFGVGAIPGAIVGGAGGAAAGRAEREARSAALPGEDYPGSKLEKAARVGASILSAGVTDVAMAGAGELAGPAVKYAKGAGRRALGRRVSEAAGRTGLGEKGAEEAIEAFRRSPAEMKPTLAEATLSKEAIEKTAKGAAAYPEVYQGKQLARLREFTKRTDAALERIGTRADPERAARGIATLHKADVAARYKTRKAAADEAFGRARSILGQDKVVQTGETMRVIQETVEKVEAAGPLQRLRQRLGGRASIAQVQDELALLNEGRVVWSGDLTKQGNKRLQSKLKRALLEDIQKTASDPEKGFGAIGDEKVAEAARALLGARKQYAELSDEIRASELSLLARSMRKMFPKEVAGEVEKANALHRGLTSRAVSHEDTAKMLSVADRIAPEQSDILRRAAADDLLSKARSPEGLQRELGVSYDPQKLGSVMSDPFRRKRLAAILGGEKSAQFKALDALGFLGRRMGAAEEGVARAMPKGSVPGLQTAAWAYGGGASAAVASAASGPASRLVRRLFQSRTTLDVITDPAKSMRLLGFVGAKSPKRASVVAQSLLRALGPATRDEEEE